MMNMRIAIGSLTLTALLFGTTGTADARGSQFHVSIDKDDGQFGPSLDPRRHGYEHAYRDGADRGRFDLEHGIRYNLNVKIYNDTARGYQPFMGNKKQYQQGYREGYKAGYDSAYHGGPQQYGQIYGRTEENGTQTHHATDPYASRRWGGMDMAFDVGYRDGVTAGQYDRRRDVRSNYETSDAYRNANHGYGNGYGQRVYQTQYRTGFQRGYQDGYGRSH
jgi:hypothetical protein